MENEPRDPEVDCSIITALNFLSKKWIVFIFAELLSEYDSLGKGLYFSDLLSKVKDKYGSKISPRVLSDSLQNLESEGIISRDVITESMPVRVSYSLTPKGDDFKIVLSALKGWGVKYGGVKQKVCQNFSCVHNTVPIMDIDKSSHLLSGSPIFNKE
jgi:DNA-binding HxlR family transcriptional regulator